MHKICKGPSTFVTWGSQGLSKSRVNGNLCLDLIKRLQVKILIWVVTFWMVDLSFHGEKKVVCIGVRVRHGSWSHTTSRRRLERLNTRSLITDHFLARNGLNPWVQLFLLRAGKSVFEKYVAGNTRLDDLDLISRSKQCQKGKN